MTNVIEMVMIVTVADTTNRVNILKGYPRGQRASFQESR